MNFTVQTDDLLKGLTALSGVVSTSTTLPILDCFLFELMEGNRLKLSASDLQTVMTTSVEIETSFTGIIAVPSDMIVDILKNLPSQQVLISVNTTNFNIGIEYFGGECVMAGFNGNEFPKPIEMEEARPISVKAETLIKAISKVLFATGGDELLPALAGVYCESNQDGLAFAATDRHKMSTYNRLDIPCGPTDPGASFVIPKKPLSIIKGLIKESDDVVMTANKSNVSFSFGSITLVCRLVDQKFPNYKAVIPNGGKNRIIVNRAAILQALKRVSIFSNKTSSLVRLKMNGQELSLKAEDIDFSTSGIERLTCNYSGTDIEIGFNAKYLTEMVANLDSDDIEIVLNTPMSGGVISPVGEALEVEKTLMLAMPIKLSQN